MKPILLTLFISISCCINSNAQEIYCYTETFDLEENYAVDLAFSPCGPSWTWEYTDVDNIYAVFEGESYELIDETYDLINLYNQILSDFPEINSPDEDLLFLDEEGYLNVSIYYKKDCTFGGTSTLCIKYIRLNSPSRALTNSYNLCPISPSFNFNSFLVPGALLGGEFEIGTIDITDGIFGDLAEAASDNYSGTYTVTDVSDGCEITSSIEEFELFPRATAVWTASPPASMLDSDASINLSSLITADATHSVTGPGTYNISGNYYFDPSAAGAEGDKILQLAVSTADGCTYEQETRTIEIVHDPGSPEHVWINILGSGFNNVLTHAPEMLPLNYDPGTYPGGLGGFLYYIKMLTLQWGHSVCEQDTINFQAVVLPDYTYKWYKDLSGEILLVGSGPTYTEYVPSTDSHLEYKIYLSATNFLGVESQKDPFIVSVNPKPTNTEDIFVCHEGDDLYTLPISYDHPLMDSMYIGGVLNLARLERMTNYNWYSSDEAYLYRGYDRFHDWNDLNKYDEYLFKRIDSSKTLLNDSSYPFYPAGIDGSTGLSYKLTSCRCEAENFGRLTLVKNPELDFISNLSGEITTGTPVLFTNNSTFSDSIIWNFGDSPYNYYEDSQWYYYYEVGFHDLSVTVLDTFGCFENTIIPNYINVTDWTSVEENQPEQLNIYPNPASDFLNIGSNHKGYRIFDSTGQEVKNGIENKINVEGLTPGIYLIVVQGDNRYYSQLITIH